MASFDDVPCNFIRIIFVIYLASNALSDNVVSVCALVSKHNHRHGRIYVFISKSIVMTEQIHKELQCVAGEHWSNNMASL